MKLKFGLVWVIFFYALKLSAQSGADFKPIKDFGTWVSVDATKKLNKKTDVNLSEQIRLFNNSTQFRASFTDLGIQRELTKKISLSFDYLLITRANMQPFQHRLFADITYTKKINKFSTDFRVRFQKKFEREKLPENYIRPKISFKYKISKKLKPYMAAEGFYHINYAGNNFDDVRFFIGCEYAYSDSKSIKLYYALDREINVAYPVQTNILGISWSLDF